MSSNAPANVLWVCTDSQRWDTLGCCGNRFVQTPNVDRLAAGGTLFENAFCQSPLCMPSRGSFLTGRYPVTNRLRQNGQTVPPDLRPITRTLADRGYVCGLAGKLHLSACDRRLELGPEWWKRPPQEWRVPVERRVDDGYSVFHWSHGDDANPYDAYAQWLRGRGVVRTAGEDAVEPLGRQVGAGRPPALTHTAFCVDKAVEFLELRAAKGFTNPWFFSVNFVDPHPDFHPPRAFLERYLERLDEIPLPAWREGELENKPSHQRESHAAGQAHSTRDYSPRDLRLIRAAYWAMCDHVDDALGRLLDVLDRTGQRENTLVIFTSDHGELLGDHGRTWKGPYLYDPCIRVPLVVSWPGRVAAGRRVRGLVELTDLAPTVLEALGRPPDPAMQGRSLWPLLTGAAPTERFRDDVYCEYYNANPDRPAKWLTMVRTERHKLIAVHGTEEGELYDLGEDPGEHRNRWDDPAAKDLKVRLLLRLAARMAFTADPLPARIGVY
jgi:arylsulfatase A-like enzyme